MVLKARDRTVAYMFKNMVLFLILLAPTALHAVPMSPAPKSDSCGDWKSFTEHEVPSGRSATAIILKFRDGVKTCVQLSDSDCSTTSYKISPQSIVLLGEQDGGFRCVYVFDDQGSTGGWVARKELAPLTLKEVPDLKLWVAHWNAVGGDDVIDITISGKGLSGKGKAYWPMVDPPTDQYPGGPNLGGFQSGATPEVTHGNKVVFTDSGGECTVVAHLLGDVLLVSDNHECGGMNVTFDGVYEKGN